MCTSLSSVESFTDYFLYQPNPRIASHPSIWIPVFTEGWTWAGGAQAQWCDNMDSGGLPGAGESKQRHWIAFGLPHMVVHSTPVDLLRILL
jgi:hypothetical protein